ncbi:hypothetical protein G7Z17_g7092 [Cylindrodendrum hubeiense]|uniref:Protoporphyrinogen oxidase n=1 Tax=Cylindrodendrum hubeiense TaxID=595255 RepID=A0A9P5HC15_9HYPO|nr:hypothetical protein G7Z17_g7092 [Cylindrodendrum hubeiense]
MGRWHAQSAAVALLSSAAPSATANILARPLNCAVWRRSLTTSAPLVTARQRRLACDPGRNVDRRRTYASAPTNADIAVLGGGLTGLTTAYYLAKKLPPTANITLYEAGDRLGGWIRTERVPVDVDGKKGTVLFERGPRSLTSLVGNTWRYDDLVFYDLSLDLGLVPVSPPSMPRYIYYPDHLVPLPPAIPISEIFSEPLYLQNIPAALMILWKSTLGSKGVPKDDPSISEWLYEISNSRKAAATMASAMVHGIYGGDIDKLSAKSVFDRIYWGWYLPSLGSRQRPMPMAEKDLIETLGKDKQIQKLASEPKGALLDFGAEGMESLPNALEAALRDQPNVTIKLNTPITSLKHDTNKDKIKINTVKGETTPNMYHKVISTISGQALAGATHGDLPSLAKSHSVDVMTVNFWFPQENIKPPGTGYLIPSTVPPEANPENVLGVFFDSDIQTRGPDEPAGTKLFVLMGGHFYDRPGVSPPSEAEAILQARAVLERHLGIPRDAPCHAIAGLAKQCIPQHYVGHQERMRAAHGELRNAFKGRLAVAGGSYTRIGVAASMRAGYDIATAVAGENSLTTTGLEVLDTDTNNFVVMGLDDIPVRRF